MVQVEVQGPRGQPRNTAGSLRGEMVLSNWEGELYVWMGMAKGVEMFVMIGETKQILTERPSSPIFPPETEVQIRALVCVLVAQNNTI